MKPKLAMIKAPPAPGKGGSKGLLAEVRELILEARQTVARGVIAAFVLLYWNVGQRIRKEILREKRAEYGQMIFSTLSRKLMFVVGDAGAAAGKESGDIANRLKHLEAHATARRGFAV